MNRYLVLYNGVSAALWTYVLGRAFQDAYGYLTNNQQSFYGKSMPLAVMEALLLHTPPHHFLVLLQFFNAVFETGHTVLGLVPSPLTTVLLQFAARLFITHGITLTLPYAPGNFHPAYLGLSFSWAITEVTRYSYYVVKLVNGHAPRWFTWLRYSLFIVLYPMGLVCEATVVYLSLVVALDNYYWFLVFGLTMYVPGFLSLYSYMWRQRRKILGGKLNEPKINSQ